MAATSTNTEEPLLETASTSGRWLDTPAVIALVAYAGLAVLLLASAWLHPSSRLAGVPGDPEQVSWFLGWTPYALWHGHDPFFTTHLNYPSGVNLAWNTTMPLVGLLSWPLRWAFGPILTYNLLLTVAFASSAWCAFLALRRYVTWAPAAFAGGLLYGFSPYMTAQAWGHLNLVFMAMPPLLFLLLDELLMRRRYPSRALGALLGVLFGLQFLTSEEVVASAALAAGVGLAVAALLNPGAVRERLPDALGALAMASLVFLSLTAWPLYVQFFGAQRLHGALNTPDVYVTDLANLVVPTRGLLLAPHAALDVSDRFSGNVSEWDGYIGAPLLLICLVAVIAGRRNRLTLFAALSTVILLLLSLGEHVHFTGDRSSVPGPWLLVSHLPLLENLIPARLMAFVYFFLALLMAQALSRVASTRGRWRPGLALAVGVVCLLPLLPGWPFPTSTPVVPAYFSSGAVRELPVGANVLVLPFAGPICPDADSSDCAALDPMLWQAVASYRYRMPGGYYTGPGPDGRRFWLGTESETSRTLRAIAAGTPPEAIDSAAREALRAEWRDWRLDAVLLGPMPHQAEMLAFLTGVLGRPPLLEGGVHRWLDLPATGRP